VSFLQSWSKLLSTLPPPFCNFKKANSITSCSLRPLTRKNIFPVVSNLNYLSFDDLKKSSTTGLKDETAP